MKLAALAACGWFAWNWHAGSGSGDQIATFAGESCLDATRSKYDTSRANVHSTRKSENGYVVKIAVTLSRGATARVSCVTNAQGGVRFVTIEEH